MSEFEFENHPRGVMWFVQNLLCYNCCCKNRLDEVPLLSKLKICDLFLQIIHRILIWLVYLLLLIVGVVFFIFLYFDNFGKRLDLLGMGYTIWICDGRLWNSSSNL
jgi:hypothetical protein